ncbi:MAG: rhomboid family intramembrane serine protease [Candidatus Binatia bacterium]
MIPLRDNNPTVLWPVVTVAFIIANSSVFLYELSLGPRALDTFIFQMGMVPAHVLHAQLPGTGGYVSLVSSMFLHGGWMHLIGNMLYLWIFGNNVEDSMGHLRFIGFYLLSGLSAAGTHLAFNATSTVPTIGASGAVSGVLGAYLFLFPHARVQTLITLGWFIRIIYLPAWVLLFFWILLQVLSQALDPMNPRGGGVAYAAHIGGFVTGLALIPLFRKYRRGTHHGYA